ncbi:unnamed protein product [Clonostachys chloroleuca]|uniref:Uncharacterized protein n=1 Tax=Clonostachys chloroleuca TaxID=1926264 RepID=A0AA35MHN6_9HYPO|nr:unnamed protein product [Clonostachys chloroleuca]
MVRGHVNTDDHDGRPFQILIMIEEKDSKKEAVSSLNAYVELRDEELAHRSSLLEHITTIAPEYTGAAGVASISNLAQQERKVLCIIWSPSTPIKARSFVLSFYLVLDGAFPTGLSLSLCLFGSCRLPRWILPPCETFKLGVVVWGCDSLERDPGACSSRRSGVGDGRVPRQV